MEFDRIEALRIGQELKKLRRQRGLSLAQVETLSNGRWKAVVVGSYERADRAITIGRLSALMGLYQAPMSALFRSNEPHRDASDCGGALDQTTVDQPFVFDLNKKEELQQNFFALAQLLTHIINVRGDWNGHILSIRRSDLQMIAVFEGLSIVEFTQKLRLNRFLLQWR